MTAFPWVFLKLWPHDFIVEEATEDGEIQTIYFEKAFKKDHNLERSSMAHATLVKCGLQTMEAVEELAKLLGCKSSHVGYAGLKDGKAITSQLISMPNTSLEKLKVLIEFKKNPKFFLKNIGHSEEIIKNGNLKGNRFTVLVRTDKNFI